MSDRGLDHFKGIKGLNHLALGRTNVTDAGLFNFQKCTELTYLDLYETRVTDKGLKAFEGCKKLEGILIGENGGQPKKK